MGTKMFTAGNITIDDQVYPDGKTAMGHLGGDAIYSAVGANLWLDEVGVLTRMGEDFPQEKLQELQQRGLDTEGMVPYPGGSLWNWVLYEYDGRRRFVFRNPGPAPFLKLSPAPKDIPSGYKAAKLAFLAAMDPALQADLAAYLKGLGMVVVVDLALDLLPGKEKVVWEQLLPLTDYFIPSEAEAIALTGSKDHEHSARLFTGHGPKAAVIKLGGDGCLVYDKKKDQVTRLPSYQKAKVVDTLGAGDSFGGGFSAGLLLTGDAALAARYGTVSSSYTIEDYGALHVTRHTKAEAMARLQEYQESLPQPVAKKLL